MADRNKYVVQSLELHLFFARIMKEHSIFLEAGFTPKNASFMREADTYKQEFERILQSAVEMSSGVISEGAVRSGEIVTDYTLGTEKKTQNFTGIPIDTNITVMESRLYGTRTPIVTDEMVNQVGRINRAAKTALPKLIAFKQRVLMGMLSCEMFTANYPLLIEHIIREARLYQSYVNDLENGMDLEQNDKKETELFWNEIMMEHALFIRGLLDPSENELVLAANDFANQYQQLTEELQSTGDATLSPVTAEILDETIKFKDFKTAGTKGIAECKIRSIILPLLADHVLREANHYIRLLENRNASAMSTFKKYSF